MRKNYNKDYKHIVVKYDEDFKNFEKLCEKMNIKKATLIKALMRMFNENPKIILEHIIK